MEKNQIRESDNKFYESIQKLKLEFSSHGLSIQDYNLEIFSEEDNNLCFEVVKNDDKFGILVTFKGELKFNPKSDSVYATDVYADDVYLRKFYIMKNKKTAQEYCKQIKGLKDLLDVPVFGFNKLGDDLIQEIEMELNQETATMQLTC